MISSFFTICCHHSSYKHWLEGNGSFSFPKIILYSFFGSFLHDPTIIPSKQKNLILVVAILSPLIPLAFFTIENHLCVAFSFGFLANWHLFYDPHLQIFQLIFVVAPLYLSIFNSRTIILFPKSGWICYLIQLSGNVGCFYALYQYLPQPFSMKGFGQVFHY
jgi:hypothetical protein